MNPLARLLQMSPEMAAYQDTYSEWMPRNGGDAQLYYQAMNAMRGMPQSQRPATDWENDENIRRYIMGSGHTAETGQLMPGYPPPPRDMMWMRKDPNEERMWQYATEGLGLDENGYPGDIGYETEEEDVRAAGWAPVLEYIDEQIAAAQETNEDPIPKAVRLKLEKILGRK